MDDILPRVAKKPRTWSKNSVRQEVDRYFTAAPWSEEEERKAAEEEAARKAAEDEAARKADEEEAEAARRAAEEEASERCLALVKLVKDNEMLSEIEVASVVVEATSILRVLHAARRAHGNVSSRKAAEEEAARKAAEEALRHWQKVAAPVRHSQKLILTSILQHLIPIGTNSPIVGEGHPSMRVCQTRQLQAACPGSDEYRDGEGRLWVTQEKVFEVLRVCHLHLLTTQPTLSPSALKKQVAKRLTKSTATSPTSLSSTFIAHTMDPATSFKLRQTLVALKIRVSWNNTFQSLIP